MIEIKWPGARPADEFTLPLVQCGVWSCKQHFRIDMLENMSLSLMLCPGCERYRLDWSYEGYSNVDGRLARVPIYQARWTDQPNLDLSEIVLIRVSDEEECQ